MQLKWLEDFATLAPLLVQVDGEFRIRTRVLAETAQLLGPG